MEAEQRHNGGGNPANCHDVIVMERVLTILFVYSTCSLLRMDKELAKLWCPAQALGVSRMDDKHTLPIFFTS